MTKKIVPINASPMRRSPATNLAPPELQKEFIDSARHAMGQPAEDDVASLIGKLVKIVFNGDREPVTGVLTHFIDHPSSAPYTTYLVLDDDEKVRYSLHTIQSIEEISGPPELTEGSLGWR